MRRELAPILLVLLLVVSGCSVRSDRGPSEKKSVAYRRGACAGLNRLAKRMQRGWVPTLAPELSVIPHVPNYIGLPELPVHTGPWGFLTRVPLLLYGPRHIRSRGSIARPVSMVDLAPTTARLIGFDKWPARSGRVLNEGLRPRAPRPRLVVTLVWDGGGRNVLREHPKAWPNLHRLIDKGSFFENMNIGSSPSVTAPVHTTLGTGAWPRSHGIPGIRIKSADYRLIDPFQYIDPSRIRIPTLADLYDKWTGNRARVAMLGTTPWHLGMIGKGAAINGGDFDDAVLLDDDGQLITNKALYHMPDVGNETLLHRLFDEVDRSDGRADRKWTDGDLDDPLYRKATPAQVEYEEYVLERLVTEAKLGADSVPDLLYVNFKAPDDAGHRWGMTSSQVGRVIRATDAALGRIVRTLDREVGAQRWVLLMTADHGQMPYPWESGGWAINGGELRRDINAEFDHNDNDVALVQVAVAAGVHVREEELQSNGVTLQQIADFIADYRLEQNTIGSIPEWYKGSAKARLFDAVLARRRLAATSCRKLAP